MRYTQDMRKKSYTPESGQPANGSGRPHRTASAAVSDAGATHTHPLSLHAVHAIECCGTEYADADGDIPL